MAIYMDRHYTEEATRRGLEDAHEKDLHIQDKHGVQFLTYWFDDTRRTGFCLVESPSKEAIKEAHDEAHGDIPHEIIEVDPNVVKAFLGRINDPTPSEGTETLAVDSAFRAIMFTDLKDSTLMTTMYGDERALHLLHIHNALTRNALREYNGSEVKHTGDGIMASFPSASDAVKCAALIQQGFGEHNARHPGEELYVRIGLGAGEPIEEHGDLFGNAVQLAARLCAHADPEQILAAQIVKDAAKSKTPPFKDKGEITPKGFEESVSIYEVAWQQ